LEFQISDPVTRFSAEAVADFQEARLFIVMPINA
jgi:hypothetical protein